MSHWIPADQMRADQLGTAPFLFAHGLAAHDLFTESALTDLIAFYARMGRGEDRGYFRTPDGTIPWGAPGFEDALKRAYASLHASGVRIKLTQIDRVREYSALMSDWTHELNDLSDGWLMRHFKDPKATLFLSSPGEITPYHMDEELNFLLQFQGAKAINIWDGRDPAVVTKAERHNYFMGNEGTAAFEKTGSGKKQFALVPGFAVHNPGFFPHMVENGGDASVSLSIGYVPRDSPRDVYRFNAILRSLGMHPGEPGRRRTADRCKRAAIGGVRGLKRAATAWK